MSGGVDHSHAAGPGLGIPLLDLAVVARAARDIIYSPVGHHKIPGCEMGPEA